MALSSSDVIALVRSLRTEAGEAFDGALDTVATMLDNILEHPEDAKYRSVRLGNVAFHRRLGCFSSGIALLRCLGFEDACQDGGTATSHLALPVAPRTAA